METWDVGSWGTGDVELGDMMHKGTWRLEHGGHIQLGGMGI